MEGGLFEKRGSSSISNSILLFGSISTTHSSVYSFIRPKKWKVNYSKKENLRQIRFSSFVLFQRHIPPYISLYVRKSGLFEKRESSSNSILLLLFQRYTPLYFFIRPKKWKMNYSKKEDLRRCQILLFAPLLFQRYTLPYIPLYVRKSGRWIIRARIRVVEEGSTLLIAVTLGQRRDTLATIGRDSGMVTGAAEVSFFTAPIAFAIYANAGRLTIVARSRSLSDSFFSLPPSLGAKRRKRRR